MLYIKNVGTLERVARVFGSLGIAAASISYYGPTLYGVGIAIGAIGFALTGVIGWCPMCAMVGRKLDKKS
jgi:hypothetical protein